MSEQKGSKEKQQPSTKGVPEGKGETSADASATERKGLPAAKSAKTAPEEESTAIENLSTIRKPTGVAKTKPKARFEPTRQATRENDHRTEEEKWEAPEGREEEPPEEVDPAKRPPAPEEQAAAMGKAILKAAKKVLFIDLKLVYVVIAGVILVVWIHSLSYDSGVAEGRRLANKEASFDGADLDPTFSSKLNATLIKMRAGQVDESLEELKNLQTQWPSVVSMNYLVALAALEKGDDELASVKATESIAKRQRVSDSLALLAVIESQKAARRDKFVMGNPVKRAEEYLRRSIAADPANPYPHFELASILRYAGKRDEALAEVRAAQARLSLVDSHLVMDVTAQIMERETMSDAQLPPDVGATDNVQKLVPAAYVAMRRGNFDRAAELLTEASRAMTPAVFGYVINDPALRRYRNEPKLRPFFAR
ncbi:hypothetical protein TSACC_3570 [Terrimicrobium sacchariphilum]|jgi:tetratricopeptide (TPR) repeat protein|uniref:Tetratricopeptide repeat-containing protein n=1 Tax=Terrimicrobium sacchariphilum TaxID=690879 RepID=A0A146GEG1_TERSA|nr:tetratricopeptide repeat protein [Terrimicrobium sacchariphilum]GAT35503.1 hypothetical protein TSACC_3570 [Terrimicrobium sacchariphilum]